MLALLLQLACSEPAPARPDPAPQPEQEEEQDEQPRDDPPSSGLYADGPVICTDPDARSTLGPMRMPDLGSDWRAQRPTPFAETASLVRGGGLVVADLTGDGRKDVLLPNLSPCQLFVADADGRLHDETETRLPGAFDACGAWGASAIDFDGDRDLDLLLAGNGRSDRLLLNDGQGVFTEAPGNGGLTDHICGSRTGSWGDIDGDGDLDLFVARHHVVITPDEGCHDGPPTTGGIPAGDPNSLYENLGDGSFADVSDRLGYPQLTGYTFVGAWLDLDQDHDQDLYLVNDYGPIAEPCMSLYNDGSGRFAPLEEDDGLGLATEAMGIGVGDLNADGRPDLAITDVYQMHLLISDPGRPWYDAAASLGLVPALGDGQRTSWGVELADMNNDGLLDLIAAFGPVEEMIDTGAPGHPDGLWLQQADGSFVDVAPAWGLDQETIGRGLVLADLNDDGWLDVARTDYRNGPAIIHTSRCGSESWLMVRLEGEAPNTAAIGARVDLVAGDRVFTRWMLNGSITFASSGPMELHFGLGELDRVDELVVTWPGGGRSRFGSIEGRQVVTIVQEEALVE